FRKSTQVTGLMFRLTAKALRENRLIDIATEGYGMGTKPPDPRGRHRKELLSMLFYSNDQLLNPDVRFLAAISRFHTGQTEAALADLEWLTENPPVRTSSPMVLIYKSLALARLQRNDEAMEVLRALETTSEKSSLNDYVAIILAAWRKDVQTTTAVLEEAVVNYSANAEDLYNIACAAALSSEAFGRLQLAEQQAIFQRRALEILKKAIQM
ncbi:MAG: hypothetical protein ACKPJJ_21780, partial [Planctomycetaceae bacterium]